jgi:hypothetical protein
MFCRFLYMDRKQDPQLGKKWRAQELKEKKIAAG